ncbi:MAG: DEAD/DEAH box helicase [Candidatus Rhabdochlamydia sp.]
MEPLLEGSFKQIQELAKSRLLTWNGQKVALDPFLTLGVIVDVFKKGDLWTLSPVIQVGNREEALSSLTLIAPLGALEGGIFRFWEDSNSFEVLTKCHLHTHLSSKQLHDLQEEGFALRFHEEVTLKPAPFPLLKLMDSTGGFANLIFDYQEWGQTQAEGQLLTPDEKLWENDLLETQFYKKRVGNSFYFCPLDQVSSAISFLLDLGWNIIDYQGKKVVRHLLTTVEAISMDEAILLRGTLNFKDHVINIEEVQGSFKKHTRWLDLSPSHTALLDLPPAYELLSTGEKVKGGLRFHKHDMGLLQEIAPLPACYQEASWESVTIPDQFQGKLFDYQYKGVCWLNFLYKSRFSALLADEMGLGKTVQTLAFLTLTQGPALIIAPVTLLSLWKHQIKQFLPSQAVYMHQGLKRHKKVEELKEHTVILTSYATLRQDITLFQQLEFDTLILDEAQMIKNRATQITQAVLSLKGRFRLALTGTPIENRMEDILSLFQFLMPEQTFYASSQAVTYKKMKPFILRRTKESVHLDLPEKMVQVIEIDPSDEEFASYEQLLQTRRRQLLQADEKSIKSLEVLELILRLRQHTCHPSLVYPEFEGQGAKFTQALLDLEEAVLAGHKVLFYSQFTTLLKKMEVALQEKRLNYVYLDGSTKNREDVVHQFQNDPDISIFLISLKAGGVGLNLQAADYVFIYDPWWNHAIEAQAIDRAHRVGQKKQVIARKYILNHSIEAKILSLQAKKAQLCEAVLSEQDQEFESLSFAEIKALLDL